MEYTKKGNIPWTPKYRSQKNVHLRLIDSLENPFATARVSLYHQRELLCNDFHSSKHYDQIGLPVLEQSFKPYKKFFKRLKGKCVIPEFIFALNGFKNAIENFNDKILDSPFKDEYFGEYPFDYNEVVIFIERYIEFCKLHISDILYQYSFDMQKELFYGKNDLKSRLRIIENNLSTIYFNEKYNKENASFIFGGNDFGIIYSIKQIDAKNFFESEILKEEYQKAKVKYSEKNDYFIDTSLNPITWDGTQTELIELIKALIENGSIKGESQKNIISSITQFLNIDVKNPDKLISDIKKRNNGSETLFLDKLKTILYNYIQK